MRTSHLRFDTFQFILSLVNIVIDLITSADVIAHCIAFPTKTIAYPTLAQNELTPCAAEARNLTARCAFRADYSWSLLAVRSLPVHHDRIAPLAQARSACRPSCKHKGASTTILPTVKYRKSTQRLISFSKWCISLRWFCNTRKADSTSERCCAFASFAARMPYCISRLLRRRPIAVVPIDVSNCSTFEACTK